jgi:hypothetical protein
MRDRSSWLVGMVLAGLLSFGVDAESQVAAASFFTKSSNDTRRYVYIQLPPGQSLVFSESENEKYYLHGRALIISASRISVDGNVVVHSFSADDHGQDHTNDVSKGGNTGPGGLNNQGNGNGTDGQSGLPGEPGAAGGDGPQAQPVQLRVQDFVGTGEWTFTIDDSGGKGGHGGKGGIGGTGGRGGQGKDGDSSHDGADAGNGGPGGPGGHGGTGGPGGAAGLIQYSKSLCSLIASGRLKVIANAGDGGDPGEGNLGGPGGSPGDAGSGSGNRHSGKGGEFGADRSKEKSTSGDKGKSGTSVLPICSDCKNHSCEKGSRLKQGIQPSKSPKSSVVRSEASCISAL